MTGPGSPQQRSLDDSPWLSPDPNPIFRRTKHCLSALMKGAPVGAPSGGSYLYSVSRLVGFVPSLYGLGQPALPKLVFWSVKSVESTLFDWLKSARSSYPGS